MAQVLGPPTPPSQGSSVIWWRADDAAEPPPEVSGRNARLRRASARADIDNQVDELARVVDVQRNGEVTVPGREIVNQVDELSGTYPRRCLRISPGTAAAGGRSQDTAAGLGGALMQFYARTAAVLALLPAVAMLTAASARAAATTEPAPSSAHRTRRPSRSTAAHTGIGLRATADHHLPGPLTGREASAGARVDRWS